MKGELLLPGQRRGKEVQLARMMEILNELYLEYHHTACSPFKIIRLEHYFQQLEVAMEFMQPADGGLEWDNRRGLLK